MRLFINSAMARTPAKQQKSFWSRTRGQYRKKHTIRRREQRTSKRQQCAQTFIEVKPPASVAQTVSKPYIYSPEISQLPPQSEPANILTQKDALHVKKFHQMEYERCTIIRCSCCDELVSASFMNSQLFTFQHLPHEWKTTLAV